MRHISASEVHAYSLPPPRMLFVALTLICLPVKAEVLTLSCDGTMKAEDQEKPHAITKMGLIVNFDGGVVGGPRNCGQQFGRPHLPRCHRNQDWRAAHSDGKHQTRVGRAADVP